MDGLVFCVFCAYHTSEFTDQAPLTWRDVAARFVRGRFLGTSTWRVIRPFWPSLQKTAVNRSEDGPPGRNLSGKSDVIFGGGNRAKGPLVKLCAHASWKLGDASILADIPRLFAMIEAELKVIFANAASGAFERDVTKLANPGLLKVKPSTLGDVLREGATPLSNKVFAFLNDLDAGYARPTPQPARTVRPSYPSCCSTKGVTFGRR